MINIKPIESKTQINFNPQHVKTMTYYYKYNALNRCLMFPVLTYGCWKLNLDCLDLDWWITFQLFRLSSLVPFFSRINLQGVLFTHILVRLQSQGFAVQEFYSNVPALPFIKLIVCIIMVQIHVQPIRNSYNIELQRTRSSVWNFLDLFSGMALELVGKVW